MAMSNVDILEKAIQKAIDNGWNTQIKYDNIALGKNWEVVGHANYRGLHVDTGMDEVSVEQIIFNQGFAKALWGEKRFNWSYPSYEGNTAYLERAAWEYHLQHMIISDNPIKYLEENI
jgi:hypothetical protein